MMRDAVSGTGTGVTVLMAVYNGAPYLRTALDSLLAQTMPRFQMVIVDDASTDPTAALIESYRDPRVELIRLERNIGQTAALNVGLRRASTPWIARMDADDYAAPGRLEAQLRAIEQDATLGCVGTFAWVFSDDPRQVDDVIEKPTEDAAIKRQLLRIVPLIHGSLLVRRDLLLAVGAYDERYRYSADWELYTRLLPRCRAANIPQRLMGLRRHPGQGSFTRASLDENLQIFSRLLSQPGRAREDRAAIHSSLAYTYCARARASGASGRLGPMLSDLGRAVRWAPVTAVRQLAASAIPPRAQARVRAS